MVERIALNGTGLKAAVSVVGIILGLSAGSAMAGTISATNYTLPNGLVSVNMTDTIHAPDGGQGGAVAGGTIALATSIGSLNAYCTDVFDYIYSGTNYTFNQNQLTTSSQYSNGATSVNWSQTQVNLLTALLENGSLQATNTINSAALQIAIWETEYGTAAANGTYNLSSTNSNFYMQVNSGDGNSAAAISMAQTYLNDVTGYVNGDGRFIAATWGANSSQVVEYLTATAGETVQNLIYLASATTVPEPSTIALFGLGLGGLWFARRRKLI